MAIISELSDSELKSSKKKKSKGKKSPEEVIMPMKHSILLRPPQLSGKKVEKAKIHTNPDAADGNQATMQKTKQNKRKFVDEEGNNLGKTKEKNKNPKSSIDVSTADDNTGVKATSEQKPGSRFQKPLAQKKFSKHKDKSLLVGETLAKNAASSKKSPFQKNKQLEGKKREADESKGSEPSNKKQITEKMVELSKKERKLIRKATKNNYEVAMKAKQMWEVLRNHEKSKDEAKKLHLCQQLHNLIKGKVNELIYAHDTSRVIECLVGMGNSDIRTALYEELKGQILQLSKSVYAKFFVLKLLKYGTKEQRNELISSVYGHVVKLIAHSEAANVVEEMYNEYAMANQRTAMTEEFYGPTFQLFKDNEIRTLDQVLAKDPSKKETILAYMKEILMKLVDKPVLRHSLVQHIIYEYITHCTEKDKAELIESLRESLVQMIHTRDGSRVAMHCIWHGTTKDRKMIIKSLKTHVEKVCKEEHGHMVLMALFDCVDDTKLVHKALLDELSQSLKELLFDQHGRKVILHLLAPRDTVYHHPDIIKLLQQGDGNAHSKKDKDIRWKELLTAVSPNLCNVFAENLEEIISSPPATIVAKAFVKSDLGDKSIVFKKIAELVAEPLDSGVEGKSHIIEDTAGHLLLKCLIKEDKRRAENDSSADLFCRHLLQVVPHSAYSKWIACNRASFILISILETEIKEITEKLKIILDPLEKHIAKKPFKGAEILLKKL